MIFLSIDENISKIWEQKPSLWEEKKLQIRSELGDEIDVFALKNFQNHILLYNPAILSKIYDSTHTIIHKEVEKWSNKTGLSSFFKEEFSSLEEKRKHKILKSLIEEHINTITKKFGLGVLSLSSVNFEENKIEVKVDECAEAHETSTIGHPICFNMASILAGEIGGKFNNWHCYEKECKASGSNTCKFIIAPQEQINEELREFLDLPSRISFTLQGKITSMISEFKRDIDYTRILEESTNRLSYILPNMDGRDRKKLGSDIHLKGFQQFYLSFLNDDFEERGKTLYEVGFESGKRFSKIISVMGMRSQDKLNVLPRLFDRLGMGLLELEKESNGYKVRVKECGYSYGLHLEENICFYNSGFFSGIISSIENQKFEGKETKCSGNSSEYCVHSIQPSEKEEKSE